LLVLGGVDGAAELVGRLPEDVLDLLGGGGAEQLRLVGGLLLTWRHRVDRLLQWVSVCGSAWMVSVPSVMPAAITRVRSSSAAVCSRSNAARLSISARTASYRSASARLRSGTTRSSMRREA